MAVLLEVILPVFLVIGAGYVSVWRNVLTAATIDALMQFSQKIAIPCLLFIAIARLDLRQQFEADLLISFFAGAITGFFLGMAGARIFFARPWTDAVAIGFVGMFSNSVLLGLAITERAFGAAALEPNYAIISVHAPICYCIGVAAMEIARGQQSTLSGKLRAILMSMFSNALVVGIGLGFLVNLSGLALPGIVNSSLDLLVRAAIPTALFGLGGVLYRYRPDGDARTIAYICVVSLLIHPAITYGLGSWLQLEAGQLRSAVLTAAMAPGVNVYLFANIYGVGKRVAATTVLIGTALSIFTAWGWLALVS